jgi:hypothetical protein
MDLRQIQTPLKQRYREEPDAARITLRARGSQAADAVSCSVDIGRLIQELDSLARKTERYCTVLQTLRNPPRIESRLG